jgi:hypothetical protein
MTASEIINEVANNREYKSICSKLIGPSLFEDLFHELIIILCE